MPSAFSWPVFVPSALSGSGAGELGVRPHRMKRIWVAFIVCALAYPLVVLFSGKVGAVGGAIVVATFTVIACLLGIPVFAWYRTKGWLRWWQFAFGGCVIGIAAALPFLASGSLLSYLAIAAVFGAIGACHAAAFWLLAIFKNERIQGETYRLHRRQ